MDVTAARAAMENCDFVALLRSLDCDQFSEANLHGEVCSARIGTTVYLVPPSDENTENGVRTVMAPVAIARHRTVEKAIEHYESHIRAMRAAVMVHDIICGHHGDGEHQANPLMDMLGMAAPDTLPNDWQD